MLLADENHKTDQKCTMWDSICPSISLVVNSRLAWTTKKWIRNFDFLWTRTSQATALFSIQSKEKIQ